MVELLPEKGKAKVESKDFEHGQTPLSWATGNGHTGVVELLLERGKADFDSKDSYGRTPLSWAADNGHTVVVKLLLEKGKAEVESIDKFQRTPLSWAAAKSAQLWSSYYNKVFNSSFNKNSFPPATLLFDLLVYLVIQR